MMRGFYLALEQRDEIERKIKELIRRKAVQLYTREKGKAADRS